ncbi:hypothetical protein [Streptomyces sp. WG-D5]
MAHTGFVDALSYGGLLGQAEGRTVADVLAECSVTGLAADGETGYV